MVVVRNNLDNTVTNEGMHAGTKLETQNNLKAPQNLCLCCGTCAVIVDLILNFINKFSMQGAQHLKLCGKAGCIDSRTNTPGQIPTGQIPTGHIPTGQLPPLQNTPWTYTHHKMKCEEK